MSEREGPTLAVVDGASSRAMLANGSPAKVYERGDDELDRTFVEKCAVELDLGCARLLKRCYDGRFVFDQGSATWFRWAGHYWARDDTREVVRTFQERLEAAFLPLASDAVGQAALKRTWSQRGMKNIMALVEEGGWFGISGDVWDRDPTLLAVRNGVIDLVTGELRDGEPGDYIRTAAPVRYDPNAKRDRWTRFLHEILSDPKSPGRAEDVGQYLQVLLGRALLGPKYGATVAILYGPNGRNGKDELVHALQAAAGIRLVGAIDPALLVGSRRGGEAEASSVLALHGMRLAIASETDRRANFAEAQVKRLSGGGELSGRAPYAKTRTTFTPTHTLVLLTNHLPKYREDPALTARLHVVEFRNRFVDDPAPGSDYEFKADPNVRAELAAEAPGVLSWLVDGAILFLRDRLQRPEEVKRALAEYEAEADPMGTFLRETTEKAPGGRLSRDELLDRFLEWRGEGVPDDERERTRLRKEMTAAAKKLPHADIESRKSNSARIIEVRGVKWKS